MGRDINIKRLAGTDRRGGKPLRNPPFGRVSSDCSHVFATGEKIERARLEVSCWAGWGGEQTN